MRSTGPLARLSLVSTDVTSRDAEFGVRDNGVEDSVGLVRVVVMAPGRRLDLALPEQAPVASVLPAVLAHAVDRQTAADGAGEWVLRRRDGTPLDIARSTGGQGVRDGEMLYLVRSHADWPEPEHDDVVDAIAAAARHGGMLWNGRVSRWTGAGITGVLVATALGVCLRYGPQWSGPAVACLLLALGCLVTGAVLTYATGFPREGYVVSAYALPAAFTGGLLWWGGGDPLGAFGAPHLLTACSALFVASALGLVVATVHRWLFGAAALAAGLVGIAAAVTLGPPGAGQVAAGLVAVVMLLTAVWPMLAARLGRIPLPELPRSPAELVRDEPPSPTSGTVTAVLRGDRILTGLLAGSAATIASGLIVIAGNPRADAKILVAVVSLACLLRARLFPTLRHRLPMLLCGLAGLVALATVVPAAIGDGGEGALWAVPVLAMLAVLSLLLGVHYAGRRPSIYLSRSADIVEIILMLAVVPLACGPLGIYTFMRGVAG